MAEAMLSIINQSAENQKKILEGLSTAKEDMMPIEINGEVYQIAKPVFDLIDSLHKESSQLRGQSDFGIKNNQEN